MSRRPTMREIEAALREPDARLVSAEIALMEYRKELLKKPERRFPKEEIYESWMTTGF